MSEGGGGTVVSPPHPSWEQLGGRLFGWLGASDEHKEFADRQSEAGCPTFRGGEAGLQSGGSGGPKGKEAARQRPPGFPPTEARLLPGLRNLPVKVPCEAAFLHGGKKAEAQNKLHFTGINYGLPVRQFLNPSCLL